ncbi:MAG TPA: hypothetical protein VFX59_03095 [Polyangiales bacterium]|nr:hypothetical protein [Polyangiales bacterium]
MSEWGAFPFGRPNSERPARRAKSADAVVIGVYPSAWHVRWSGPTHRPAGPTGGVQALAVDVEPTVFWDGMRDDFATRLAAWKQSVGFRDGEHGTISPVSPAGNGSSGQKLVSHYLTPLGLSPGSVTFTDVYPVFVVKSASGAKREQGDAIREEYDPLASLMGFQSCTLPPRPSERELPKLAAERFGARLLDDLTSADSSLVITLGREVWNTLVRIPQLRAQPPVTEFDALKSDHYGAVGSLWINARRVDWLPLVHPGLLGRVSDWETLHAAWAVSPKSVL